MNQGENNKEWRKLNWLVQPVKRHEKHDKDSYKINTETHNKGHIYKTQNAYKKVGGRGKKDAWLRSYMFNYYRSE